MNEQTRAAALAHAFLETPRESCGVLVIRRGREIYCPCRNIAQGTENFIMHPEDWAAAEADGEVIGIVHSHPNAAPTPSQADRVACEASGLPWHIVSVPSGAWASIEPTGYRAPLIGRQFAHGVLDCYALVRDWYRQERGIELLDFERRDNWWHNGENLYADNFRKAGFEVADAPEVGSVILMQVLANVPNHAAIYLGDDLIVHHLYNRLSSRDVYGGYFKKHTTHILRYVGT